MNWLIVGLLLIAYAGAFWLFVLGIKTIIEKYGKTKP